MEFIYTLMPHDLLKTIWIAIPLFRDDRTRVVWVYYPLQVFIIDWLLMFVNQTQEGADLRGVEWVLALFLFPLVLGKM